MFNGPFSGTTWASRYQKGKNNLSFTGIVHWRCFWGTQLFFFLVSTFSIIFNFQLCAAISCHLSTHKNTTLCCISGVGKLRPARVYYVARRHEHVRKIFEVLFRVFDLNLRILNQFLWPQDRLLPLLIKWTVTFVSLILTELCGQIVCKFSWQKTCLLS